MKEYVLARKWRPKKFSEVVGQDFAIKSIASGLKAQKVHHAYLLTGPRGIGKTTIARIIAKAINCETNGVSDNPCGKCDTCLQIDNTQYIDLYEIDGASKTKVEDIREILENVQYLPTQGKYKVYIIDEVHMLSNHSFNALLKTLEEPPEYVKFILATTDPQKIPSTILSRCLHYNLLKVSTNTIIKHLKTILSNEKIKFDDEAVECIAECSDGSIRDALSISEQCISFEDNELRYENVCNILNYSDKESYKAIINQLINKDLKEIIFKINKLDENAIDFEQFLTTIISIFHNAALYLATQIKYEYTHIESSVSITKSFTSEEIQKIYSICINNLELINYAPNKKSAVEMTFIQIFNDLNFVKSEVSNNDNLLKEKNKSNVPSEIKKTISDDVPKKKDQFEWDYLVSKLNVDGVTSNLLLNLEYIKKVDNVIEFNLQEEIKDILTEKSKLKLSEEIERFVKEKVVLNINIVNSVSNSINEVKKSEIKETYEKAQKQIDSDDFVKAIKSEFDAKKVSNVIQKEEKLEEI